MRWSTKVLYNLYFKKYMKGQAKVQDQENVQSSSIDSTDQGKLVF